MRKSLLYLLLLIPASMMAQKELHYENYIYEDQIRTVQVTQPGTSFPVPYIKMGASETLTLSFDELATENDYYQYTLVHCDANWNPSNLRPLEYLSGSMFENVNDFKYSNNTYQKYIHYSVTFPNENMRPKFSGNYLLKVYRNFDESDLIITRRIFVIDPKASFTVNIHPATVSDARFSKQEIDFKVKIENYLVVNPYQDLKVVVSQNNRWDNAIYNLKPRFIVGNEYDYNYEFENLMDGTNEYRFFDFRSLRFYSQNVNRKFFDTLNHLVLTPEEKRGAQRYFQYIDFNGKRVIANKDMKTDGSFDGDYAWVYFTLNCADELRTGNVYILGEMTDWRAQDKFRMEYNYDNKRYEAKVKLKQGYYSYLYVTKNWNTGALETIETEGNYMETENDYYIYYYCRNQAFDYDELIGFEKFNSNDVKDKK